MPSVVGFILSDDGELTEFFQGVLQAQTKRSAGCAFENQFLAPLYFHFGAYRNFQHVLQAGNSIGVPLEQFVRQVVNVFDRYDIRGSVLADTDSF